MDGSVMSDESDLQSAPEADRMTCSLATCSSAGDNNEM